MASLAILLVFAMLGPATTEGLWIDPRLPDEDVCTLREALDTYPEAVFDAGLTGETILHRAAGGGRAENVAMLLERDADVDAVDATGSTPLHWAARSVGFDAVEVVETLLDAGADVEARDNWSATPLHLAVMGFRIETARLLLERGADVDAVDATGSTPLHWAARNEDAAAVVALLHEYGADADVRDICGRSPRDFPGWREAPDAVVARRSDDGGKTVAQPRIVTDCDSEEQREIRRLRAQPKAAYFGTSPLVRRVYAVSDLRLDEAATAVRTVLTPRGRLEVDRDKGTLVVMDYAYILASAEAMLERMRAYAAAASCETR
jgi:hypothetical protein